MAPTWPFGHEPRSSGARERSAATAATEGPNSPESKNRPGRAQPDRRMRCIPASRCRHPQSDAGPVSAAPDVNRRPPAAAPSRLPAASSSPRKRQAAAPCATPLPRLTKQTNRANMERYKAGQTSFRRPVPARWRKSAHGRRRRDLLASGRLSAAREAGSATREGCGREAPLRWRRGAFTAGKPASARSAVTKHRQRCRNDERISGWPSIPCTRQ